jgi:hypothetical protein
MHAAAFYLSLMFIFAQEGHPLVGSWHGNWGTNTMDRRDITVIMDWDGKMVSGVVNPGFDNMQLQNARLFPKDWAVHFASPMARSKSLARIGAH